MSDLDDVISIQLTRGSQAVATASFQIPMILSQHTSFIERSRIYTSISGVGADFSSSSNTYKIASQLFGQSTVGAPPSQIVVGKRNVGIVTVSIPTVANLTAYSITVGTTVAAITSAASATATTIVTQLIAAIGVQSGLTIVNLGATFTIAATVADVPFVVKGQTTNIALVNTSTETWVQALDAVEVDNGTWYAMVCESQVLADQEALSDSMQARRKIMGLSTSDVVAPTAAITCIGGKLSAKSAGRTFGVYSATAATEYPEAAWIGAQLAYTPGSNDWDFKRVVGATASKLTPTQLAALRGKGYNFHTTKGGVNVMQDGNMFNATVSVGGTPIDEIVASDWLYARLQESIYFRLINVLKVKMTNSGLLVIENEIRSVLAQAESNGMIDAGWRVTTPDVLDIPSVMRAARVAGVFRFDARLAGSIRKCELQGFLSV